MYMSAPSTGDGIGKKGDAVFRQRTVLHLKIGCAPIAFQEEVQATSVGNADFRDYSPQGAKVVDHSVLQRLSDQMIGSAGVNTDPYPLLVDHLERPGVFAFAVVGATDQYRAAGSGATTHGARVGTVHGQHLSIGKADISKKPFIAFDQGAGLAACRQEHDSRER